MEKHTKSHDSRHASSGDSPGRKLWATTGDAGLGWLALADRPRKQVIDTSGTVGQAN